MRITSESRADHAIRKWFASDPKKITSSASDPQVIWKRSRDPIFFSEKIILKKVIIQLLQNYNLQILKKQSFFIKKSTFLKNVVLKNIHIGCLIKFWVCPMQDNMQCQTLLPSSLRLFLKTHSSKFCCKQPGAMPICLFIERLTRAHNPSISCVWIPVTESTKVRVWLTFQWKRPYLWTAK